VDEVRQSLEATKACLAFFKVLASFR
jgi:hypothetical protein